MKHTRRVISWILVLAMLVTNIDYVRAANTSTQTSTNVIQDILDDVSADLVTDGDGDEVMVSENEVEVSENEVPGEDVSEDEVSQGDVSEGEVSEGDVSEGDVSEGDVSDNKVPEIEASVKGERHGITWELDEEGVLTISGKKEPDSYVDPDGWRDLGSKIKKVVVTAEDVTNTTSWFSGLSSITSFDFSEFDTSKVTSMSSMFWGCSSVKELDLSNFDTSNVTSMGSMFSGCTNLQKVDLSSFDTSEVTLMESMFSRCSSITKLDLSNFDTSSVIYMTGMFSGCTKLQEVDLSSFDTSKVTIMASMFYDCESIRKLDLSYFDTGNVTSMSFMFKGCKNLQEVDLSSFDTSKVTDMCSMFLECFELKKLDLSNFNTAKVTDMSSMFERCLVMTSLDVSNFNTANVIDMHDMFISCAKLKNVDVSSFKTPKVKNMSYMFAYCYELEKLDVSSFSGAENMDYMFSRCSGLKSINVSNMNNSKTTSMDGIFEDCYSLPTIDVSKFDTSNITDFSNMFRNCRGLKTITINGMDTSKAQTFDSMFSGCSSLTSIDISKLNTSNVTNMSYMFSWCESLNSITWAGIDTSKVRSMSGMFNWCPKLSTIDLRRLNTTSLQDISGMFSGCSSLTDVKLKGFDTRNIKYMSSLFSGCSSLNNIDVSSLDTSNVTSMNFMFSGCSGLKNLDVSNFDTSKVSSMYEMFYGCTRLKSLDLSNFNTSNVTEMAEMFSGCTSLTSVELTSFDTSNVIGIGYMFDGCTKLEKLDLSNFDMSKVTYADNMLRDCTGLEELKTFKNMSLDVELPFSPMYDSVNNEYTHMPKDTAKSVVLYANPNPNIKNSHSINIKVCDKDTKNPIIGATVNFEDTNYVTNADGVVHLVTNNTYFSNVVFEKKNYKTATKSFNASVTETTVYLERDLDINVAPPAVKADMNLEHSVELGGYDIKWLDFNYKFDFSQLTGELPVSINYNYDENVYEVVVGVNDTNDVGLYKAVNKMCKAVGEEDATSDLFRYLDQTGSTKAGDYGANVDLGLVVCFKIDPTKELPDALVEGEAVLAINGKAELECRPAMLGGVAYLKGTISVGAEGGLKIEFADGQFNFSTVLRLKQGFGIAGGVGVDAIHAEIGAEAEFSEELTLPFVSAEESFKINFKANVYAEAAFFVSYRETIELADVDLWPMKEKKTSSTSAATIDTTEMSLLPRDYKMLTTTPALQSDFVLENVYPNGEPQMVQLDNGTLVAVWLADLGTKSSANRTTLMYSVNTGNGWNEAQALCETGRGDFYPHLTADGNKAALVYMNIDTVLPDTATVADFAAHADLYTAVFENGTFSEPELLTESDNGILENNAEIAIVDNKLAVVWVENTKNDPVQMDGSNTIYLSTYTNNEWTKEKVAGNLVRLQSMAVSYVNDEPYVAYTMDADNDINTTTDIELYLWAGKQTTRVTSDQRVDSNVQFVDDMLYWAADGEVMQMQVGDVNSTKSTGINGVNNFTMLENATNRAIIFVGADGFSSELYLSEETDGSFGTPVPVTDYGNKIADYDAVYRDNGDVTAILFEREVIKDGTGIYGDTNMRMCASLAAHNVVLTGAWYSMDDLTADNKLPINLELYNASSEPLTSVTVSLNADGQAFYTETVACDIEANGVADVTINYPLNAAQMGRDVVVKAVPGNFTDSNMDDNVYDMTLGYADIVLKDFAVEKVEGESIITGTVVNEGYQAAEDVSFKVLEGGQNGAEIYSISCGDMAVGAEYPISYTIPAEKLNFESAFETKYFYVVTDTEDGEEFYGNNSQVMPVFPVRVTGLTLDAEELTMSAGTTRKLIATVAPADAINKNVYFASSSHEVAVVLEDGTIIACAEGTAEITVLTGDGHFTKTCTVTVTAPAEGTPAYTMNTRWESIEKGSTLQLSVLDGEEQVVSGINWSSTDETVATIDENGLVTAKEVGATYILCSNAEGTYNNVAVIHVTSSELQALVFEESSVEMTEGDTFEQQPIYCPEDTTTDMKLTWTSSDASVATVDAEGNVSAVGGGRATITATAVNGVSASYEVEVTALPRYTVTFDSCLGDEPIEITGILGGSTIALPAAPVRENYTFVGWFTEEYGQGEKFTSATIVEADMYLYACWAYEDQTPEGLWATDVAPQTYTGSAIKPVVQVYDGHTLLVEKTDYTISYKNNVKANDATDEKKAPTITIKGKGNYTGTETITFQILKKNLAEEDVTADALVAAANDKVQKPVPVLSYNGKKLKNKTDFTVTYPDLDNPEMVDAYKKAGTYTIHVEGKGNFEGSRDISFTITDATLISKAKIASIPKQAYTGSAIEPEVKVTYQNKTLVKGTDYSVDYKNNTEVGKATVIVTGMGDYAGTKEATFTITGISIAKAKVNGVVDKVYNGTEQTQDSFEVMLGETKLSPSDYTVSYQKNENVGKATMVITGQGNYTGTVKKTFKITARDISANATCMWASQMEYTKGGTLNNVAVIIDGVPLEEKRDYTISYSNNKKVTKEGDKKLPTFTIKGKGNYKGTIQKTYTIVPKDLSQSYDPVTITASDVAYSAKAGKYMSKPVLVDVNGKKLAAGTDYEKSFTYTLEDGTELDPKKDAPSAGTLIKVTVTGKGGYTGTATATYRIGAKAFKSAKVKVEAQVYTGSEITLEPSDIKVTMGKETLTYGEDYIIVEDSYKNNVKKGTASVTIKGVGDYAGEKTVKFKITSKTFKWFWDLF